MSPSSTKLRSGNPSKNRGFNHHVRCFTDSDYRNAIRTESARHEELVSSLISQLRIEAETLAQRDIAKLEDESPNHPIEKKIRKVTQRMDKIPEFCEKLESYCVETLEVIAQRTATSDTHLFMLLDGLGADATEIVVRETAVFPLSRTHTTTMALLRDMTGLSDLSDSARDDDLERKIRAVIIFMQKDSMRRSIALPDAKADAYRSAISSFEDLIGVKLDFHQGQKLSSGLAEVVMDNPFRIDDILDYMENRNLDMPQVDPGHLREYLALPSTVFGDGVL